MFHVSRFMFSTLSNVYSIGLVYIYQYCNFLQWIIITMINIITKINIFIETDIRAIIGT